MFQLQLTLLIPGLLSTACHAQENPVITRDELLEDIVFLGSTLEAAHADLYRVVSQPELDAFVQRVEKGIREGDQESFSTLDCYYVIQEILAHVCDEHTRVEFPSHAVGSAQRVLPIEVAVVGDKVLVARDHGDAEIAKYSEILGINGVSIEKLRRECHRFLSPPLPHARDEHFTTAIHSFLTSYLGMQSPWEIRFRDGPEERTVIMPGLPYEDLIRRRGRTEEYTGFSFEVDGRSVAVLEIPSFSHGSFGGYQRFIDDFFARHSKADVLVIDLRRNPGGHGTWGFYLLDFLTDSPYKILERFDFKVSDLFRGSGYRSKVGAALATARNGTYIPIADDPMRAPHETDSKFKGEVFLLTSHFTNSAAVVTAAVFKHARLGTVVGQETGGRTEFSSDPVQVRLPRSGLTVLVPVAVFGLPGDDPDRGVIPNVVVENSLEDLREDRDLEMEKVLELAFRKK